MRLPWDFMRSALISMEVHEIIIGFHGFIIRIHGMFMKAHDDFMKLHGICWKSHEVSLRNNGNQRDLDGNPCISIESAKNSKAI